MEATTSKLRNKKVDMTTIPHIIFLGMVALLLLRMVFTWLLKVIMRTSLSTNSHCLHPIAWICIATKMERHILYTDNNGDKEWACPLLIVYQKSISKSISSSFSADSACASIMAIKAGSCQGSSSSSQAQNRKVLQRRLDSQAGILYTVSVGWAF